MINNVASPSTRISILGVQTHAQRFNDAVRTLEAWAGKRQARRVSFCPVYTIMRGFDEPALRDTLNTADMVAADGMPVVWVQRQRGAAFAERVYGPDVMLALCEATTHSDGSGIRHFLLGGGHGVADALAENLHNRFPGINICGTYAPDYQNAVGVRPHSGGDIPPPVQTARDITLVDEIDPLAIDRIRDSGAQVVWVALGSPKQDRWMAAHMAHLDCLMIGVGAAFDFLSGRKAQAPSWMRRNGLEWAFRLASEPKRLWRRYAVENPRFVWHILREQINL